MPVSTPFAKPVQVDPSTVAKMKEAGYALEYNKLNMPTWIKTAGTPGTPTPGTVTPGAQAPATSTDPMAMYRQALEGLSGGGAMLESSLADIEAGKEQATAAGQQAMVSGGLGGTTMMAGVPIQAEKTAGRARLAARGQTEQLRLQTLASYAGLAQQAKLASDQRQAAQRNLQTQITAQTGAATAAQKAESERISKLASEQRTAATLASMRERSAAAGVPFGPGTAPIAGASGSGLVFNRLTSPPGYENYVSGGTGGTSGATLSPSIPRTNVPGIGPTTAFPSWSEPSGRGSAYSQQFPSIYGNSGSGSPAPALY